MSEQTDTIEAVARCLAPLLEGGRKYDQMPANRRELKIWNRAGMCSFNDATQEDAREAAEQAIAAHTKALVDGAGDLAARLLNWPGDTSGMDSLSVDHVCRMFQNAAATIAALQAQLATARIEGVRAGIEAAAGALEADAKLCDCYARSEGECACGAWSDYKTVPMERAIEVVRALDAAAIAKAPD